VKCNYAVISNNGKYMATILGNSMISVYDLSYKTPMLIYSSNRYLYSPRSIQFSPDDKNIVVAVNPFAPWLPFLTTNSAKLQILNQKSWSTTNTDLEVSYYWKWGILE
jgi:hypothetical protein